MRYGSIFWARPNGRSMKTSVQSIISDIFTVDDTAIICSRMQRRLVPHDVEDDIDLHRVFESVSLLYAGQKCFDLHRVIKLCHLAGHLYIG